MNFDFDYRKFQNEAQDNLAKIFAESIIEQESVDQQMVDETYSKIKRILNCPEMEKCYPYLYSLDFEHVNEDDKQKVDKLYECGLQRGVITEDNPEDEESDGCSEDLLEDEGDDNGCVVGNNTDIEDNERLCGGPKDSISDVGAFETIPQKPVDFEKPCYTVLYSANKDGEVKLGEFYSSAKTTLEARQDCEMKLSEAGYSAIEVLAIERSRYGENDEVEPCPSDDSCVCTEDDSEEYEKQETGDTSSSEDSSENDSSDDKETEDDTEQSDSEDSEDAVEDDKEEEEEKEDEKDEDAENDENADNTSSSEDSTEDDAEDKDVEDGEEKDDTGSEEDEESDDTEDDKEEDEKDEEKELTADEKNVLKDEYTKIFKDVLKKQKLDKCVDDMELDERVEFWKAISDKWSKNDPSEFLSDKDQEKLNKTVVKSEGKEDDKDNKDS